ncbi:MAG: glycosyl hydrolase-related protein, partial [Clostridiales bacterium]|nr:glycosyl hydrolase-related protein [Clostridiales bacterium]
SSSKLEVYAAAAAEIYRDIKNKLTDKQRSSLPQWKNELVMQNHGVGGYTSRAVGKRWNRRCEELADIAERGAVISSYFGLYDYNSSVFERAWKRFIAHQFHDDMPGTSVQRAHRRSWNDYALSANQFTGELEAAVSPVSSLMKTDFCTGTPVMVSNPVEADIHSAVTIYMSGIKSNYARVFDDKGREVKSQINSDKNGVKEILFIADVKSLGFKIYDVRQSDAPCAVESKISINTENVMENQKYIVTLNKRGNISSIIDKAQDELEILNEPIALGLFKYKGSRDWPAWEMNFKEAYKEADRLPQLVTVSIEENGPARVAFKVVQQDRKRSSFSNYIALTDGGECVEVYSEIEWQNLCTMAKNKFSFTCKNSKATFDLGLGAIQRGNMSEKLFEVPAQKWADITDESGKFGVSVISECKYGWDKYNDNTLRMTALHTPLKNYRIDSMQSMMDIGLNRYSFAIFSHIGKAQAAVQLEARKFIQPPTAYICSKHSGVLGVEYSFGTVSSNNVIIRAIKKAENGNEIIVRLNEGANKNTAEFKLKLGNGIESAREVFASEEPMGEAVVENGYLVTSFKPYQIRTFALKLKESGINGKTVCCEPAEIDFNKNIITPNGSSKADFNLTIPKELLPEKVTANGIEFNISDTDKNAAVMNGQKIKVKNSAEKLCLLCASLSGDKKITVSADDIKISKKFLSMTENFAGWDLPDLGDAAYVKKGKLGIEFTHSHTNGKDNIAKGLCFYIAEFDVDGKSEVTLPYENDIVIISAVFVKNMFMPIISKTFDEVDEKRKQTFYLTAKELIRYNWYKCVWNLNDRDEFITANNRGRKK